MANAALPVGTTIVCDGTATVPGPVDVIAVGNNATTSATISDGTTTFLTLGSTKDVLCAEFRSKGDLTVTVVGGGSITLFLRVK